MNYLYTILIILIIVFIAIIFICNRFFYLVITRGKKNILENMENDFLKDETYENKDKSEYDILKEESEIWFNEEKTDIFITNSDNMKLHGFFMKNETKKYAIVVHGYSGEASQMKTFAKKFHDFGFNTLLPDLRAHGESDGKIRGMGYLDRFDILCWIDYILSLDKNAVIILFGISMGASAVMMSAGEKLPQNVKLIIEDCGYSSVYEEFAYRLKKSFHMPRFPFINIFSFIVKIRGGYSIKDADAVQYIKKCKFPILFIHGSCDDFVPFYMLDKLYNSAISEKEKLVIDDAKHAESSSVNTKLYWYTVKSFLDRHL